MWPAGRGIGQALRARARLRLADGRLDQAETDYREALAIFDDLGDRRWSHRVEQLLGLLAYALTQGGSSNDFGREADPS